MYLRDVRSKVQERHNMGCPTALRGKINEALKFIYEDHATHASAGSTFILRLTPTTLFLVI